MQAGMASGLKRRFDDDDDDLSHFARCLKYRLVMTSMICVTLKMTGLTSMHHAPSFAALTSVVHLPTSKIIAPTKIDPRAAADTMTQVWYENLSGVVICPDNSNININGVVIGSRDQ